MKHPPYHLRENKAVDRMLFFDLIEKLSIDSAKYTYHGLGGPFLDDIRLFSTRFEFARSVCIERNPATHKRQKFHKNSRFVKLVNETINDYLTLVFPADSRCIFWLDYTDLSVQRVEEFKRVLQLVGNDSIVKITVNVSQDRQKTDAAVSLLPEQADELTEGWIREFSVRFNLYLPGSLSFDDMSHTKAPTTVQGILETASGQALPSVTNTEFQILHSCTYQDGQHQMLSVTGIKLRKTSDIGIAKFGTDYKFANLDWSAPHKINVPSLSVKERLLLERHLPVKTESVKAMKNCLGYKIGGSDRETEEMLRQYKDFHRFFPLYAKIGV